MNPGSSSFDPSDFLVVAKYLQQGAVTNYSFVGFRYDESRLRSAINRAYVAAFCAARNHLLDRGQIAPKSAGYTQVQSSFRTSTDYRRQQIAVKLENLRRNQVKADYQRAPFQTLMGTAYSMIISADEIVRILPQL